MSLLSIYLNLQITPYVIIAFIIISILFIDKKNQASTDQENMELKKKLDIYFRLIVSGILLLIITHEFFYALSTETVLYILLFIPLTIFLILTSK